MKLKLLYIISLKSDKLTLSICVALGKFVRLHFRRSLVSGLPSPRTTSSFPEQRLVIEPINSFAMSMVTDLSDLSFCMFKTIRLLKRSWFILERSQSFSPREVEKDLSLAALVAGSMKISLHNVITFYHFPF